MANTKPLISDSYHYDSCLSALTRKLKAMRRDEANREADAKAGEDDGVGIPVL